MENTRLHFVVLLATYLLLTRYCLSAEEEEPCKNPQNGTIGGVGIIQCYFTSGFVEIAWSYTGEGTDPLVRYNTKDPIPFRPGHGSHSYSLQIDGSLLIFDATSDDESKEYKVETLDSDGNPIVSQIVEYQFMGESTSIRRPTTVNPTTCPVTETTSSGCQGTNDYCASPGVLIGCVVVGVALGAVAVIVGVVAYQKCVKGRKERIPERPPENHETDKCIPEENVNSESRL